MDLRATGGQPDHLDQALSSNGGDMKQESGPGRNRTSDKEEGKMSIDPKAS